MCLGLSLFFSVFLRVSVCVRLARQGHGKSSTSATTSSTLRVCRPIKICTVTFLMYAFSPPKTLHNFKKNFRLYHATSPENLYNLCANFSMRLPPNICTIFVPTFPCDFPQKDFTILVPTLSMCDSPRDIVRSTQIDMLSVIHRVICVQKALSDAARAFCS